MTGFEYPPDDPATVRADAASWRAAREMLGSAGASVGSAAAAAASAWQGVAARAAVAQLERSATRHDEAAAALEEAAGILDRYAEALDQARTDVDRLNAAAAVAEQDRRADLHRAQAVPVEDNVLRSTRLVEAASAHQAAMARLRRDRDAVLGRVTAAAANLGARLQEIAARAQPARPDPTRGPATVVAHNADDHGYIDWVTHLALTHPNLTAEQQLWVLENRDELTDTLDLLVGTAFTPAVTADVVANYLETVERRNTRERLSNAFEDNRFEFMTALLLPTVVTILTGRELRIEQRTAQLTAAVLDVIDKGPPRPQHVTALASVPIRSPTGVPAPTLNHVQLIQSSGRIHVVTPRGTVYDIPPGWVGRPAANGRGIVFQRPGAY